MQTIRNHVTLIGNMGNAATITNFDNGNKVARFQLATDQSEKKTNWHNVFAWGSLASFIEDYGSKGKPLAIHGRVVNRTYLDKAGKQKKTTEVEVRHIIGL